MWLILYFPQQRALTQVETGAISPPHFLVYLSPPACHLRSICITGRAVGKSASHSFVCWTLWFRLYVITWVISLLFIQLQLCLSFSCSRPERVQIGPLAVNYWIVFHILWLKKEFFHVKIPPNEPQSRWFHSMAVIDLGWTISFNWRIWSPWSLGSVLLRSLWAKCF